MTVESEPHVSHPMPELTTWDTYYEDMTDRNIGIMLPEEQETVSRMLVAQAGVGGNADVTITLAQMGFQRFRIADPDVYGPSNLNRQLGCNAETLGRNKAVVVAEEIKKINPNAEVEVYQDGVTVDNVEEFLEDAHIVIDGIDIYAMAAKKKFFDIARRNGQAVFCCPAIGFGAAIGIFDPEKSPTFDEYFGVPPDNEDPADPEFRRYVENFGVMFLSIRPVGLDMDLARRRSKEGKAPAVAAGCRLNSALVPAAIHGYIFDKGKVPIVPTTWHIDLLGGKIVKTGRIKRWIMKKLMALMMFKGDV